MAKILIKGNSREIRNILKVIGRRFEILDKIHDDTDSDYEILQLEIKQLEKADLQNCIPKRKGIVVNPTYTGDLIRKLKNMKIRYK